MAGLPPDLQAAFDAMEPQVRRAFEEAIARITSAAQLETIIGHLRGGNVEAAVAALRIDPRFFAPLDRALGEAFYRGGVMALASLPRLKDPFLEAELSSASTPATPAPRSGSGRDPQR